MLTKGAQKLAGLGLTQSQIATKLGVGRQNVANWMSGTIPEGKTMVRIQDILRIPLTDWLEPATTAKKRAASA